MKTQNKTILLTFALSTLFACGGGGGSSAPQPDTTKETEQPTNTTKTDGSSTETQNDITPQIKAKNGSLTFKQDGKSYEISPFKDANKVRFKAEDNDVLSSVTAARSNFDNELINPIEALSIEFKNKEPLSIKSLSYDTGGVTQLFCRTNCNELFSVALVEKDNKTYFTVNANNVSSTQLSANDLESLSGEIRYEVNADWPVFNNSKRFKTVDLESAIKVNGVDESVYSFLIPNKDNIYFIALDNDKQTYFLIQGNKLSHATEDNSKKDSFSRFYLGQDGKDIVKTSVSDGVKTYTFNKTIVPEFNSDPADPSLSITGYLKHLDKPQKLDVLIDNTRVNFDRYRPYAENESLFYWFTQSKGSDSLKIQYTPSNGAINLSYGASSCKSTGSKCQGVVFDVENSSFTFNNVVFENGKVLNGSIKNIGLTNFSKNR